LFSLGHREKAVPNIDIWHAHLKSSLEEPSHPTLHKFISINILWPIAEILHVSFSAPKVGLRQDIAAFNGTHKSKHSSHTKSLNN
jgi:hypothetical protein